MGVCEVVEQMSSAVASARQPLSPREASWLHLLQSAMLEAGEVPQKQRKARKKKRS